MVKSVQEIQQAIEQLPETDRKRFHAWYTEYFNDLWDKQIEEDSLAGRLDHLIDEAIRDHEAGRTTEL